jgi:hypothetical protein
MTDFVISMLIPVPFFTALGIIVLLPPALVRAVRSRRHCEPQFRLDGIPEADRERFLAELLELCGEMARAAARADRKHQSEGTNQP